MSSDQITLRRYLDPMRRFAPLVLIGTLLGAGLGAVAHTLSGTTWTSTVSVLVSPISGDPVDGLGTSVVEVDMETEAEVATSLLVAERANDLLAGQPPAKDPRDLLGQVETSVRGTRIIEMSFTAAEPEIAQRGAAAFADAFLAYRAELATSQLEVASGRLTERVTQLQLELTDVSTRRAEVPVGDRDGAAYAALVINEQTLLDELSANQSRLADLRAVITDDAVVLDTASLPRSPSSLGLLTLVVGGAAAGFVIGAGLALMLDAARRRHDDDTPEEITAAARPTAASADAAAPDARTARVPVPQGADVPSRPMPSDAEVAADDRIDRWTEPATELPETAPATWGEPAADEDGEPARNGRASTPEGPAEPPADGPPMPFDARPASTFETIAAEPEPLDMEEGFVHADLLGTDPVDAAAGLDDVWGGPRADAADRWTAAAFAEDAKSADHGPAADDAWGVPLSPSDEDTWASIVEATARATGQGADEDTDGTDSTRWDAAALADDLPWGTPEPDRWEPETTDPAEDVPWGMPDPDRWQPETNALADAPTGVGPDAAAPIELDGILQERAVASVAQLGDHLTHAVDVDRRAIVVVDGGDGAGVPVAVAMATHLAAAGRPTLLVDVAGDALAPVIPGRHGVRDHPTLAVLVGQPASDPVALVAEVAGDDTMVVVAGAALESPLMTAEGDWAGAVVIATTGVADPASIPHDAFERVMGSRHPLIGIVSIMARPVMTPPSH